MILIKIIENIQVKSRIDFIFVYRSRRDTLYVTKRRNLLKCIIPNTHRVQKIVFYRIQITSIVWNMGSFMRS